MSSFDHLYDSSHMYRSKTPNPPQERKHYVDPGHIKRSRTPQAYDEREYQSRGSHRSARDAGRPSFHRARTQTLPTGVLPDIRLFDEKTGSVPYGYAKKSHKSEAMVEEIDLEARIWMIREETRRIAAMREVERTRLIQEEVRRIQVRIQQRREQEWQYILRRALEEEKERERHRQEAVRKAFANAWSIYEKRWASLTNSAQPLTFAAIPWPTLGRPSSPTSINIKAISAFLLSPHHSDDMSPKDRIKQALKRWHPDRFGRVLAKATAEDKAAIEEGAGVVARCLNGLLNGEVKHSVN